MISQSQDLVQVSDDPADRVLEVRNVTKVFRLHGRPGGVCAVRPTSFELRRGQSLGIVGESGSGKTTLARMICNLTEPTAGTVTFDGLEVHARHNWRFLRGRIQMVLQDPYDSLDPRLRIAASIQEPMLLSGRFTQAQAEERTMEMLERVQLSRDFADRYPEQLSGGQLQRVGIARALASGPDLVILDEPTSSLDWMTRSEIIKLLDKLRTDFSLSYLVISHDISAVAAIADEIAVMYFGAIVEYGQAAKVVREPSHPYTQALMASVLLPRVGNRRQRTMRSALDERVAHEGGCAYYARCGQRISECATTEQTLDAIGSEARVACMVARKSHPEERIMNADQAVLDLDLQETLRAVVARLIAGDDLGPRAAEAGADQYILSSLSGPLSGFAARYVDGLHGVNALARNKFGQNFARLSVPDQNIILSRLEGDVEIAWVLSAGGFVELVREHTTNIER